MKAKKKFSWQLMYKQRYLLLMSVPFVVWLVIFKYVPLWGWTMAFQDVRPKTFALSVWEREFVGLGNFTKAFTDRLFKQTMINTLGISVLQIAVGTIVAILFAVLLNELMFTKFKKLTQTISYLPHFVSWVIIASIAKNIFNDGGVIDSLVGTNLHLMSTNSPLIWMVIVIIDCWKEMGWNAIIYLSSMAGIDPGLYEAAQIDGANERQMAFHVTIPLIKSTMKVSLTFAVIGSLKLFDLIWVLTKGGPLHASEVPSTLMYTSIFSRMEYGMGSAMAIFIVLECLFFYFLIEKCFKVENITY